MKSIVEFPICQINLVWSCCVHFAINNNSALSAVHSILFPMDLCCSCMQQAIVVIYLIFEKFSMINWKSFALSKYKTRFHRFTTFWANSNNRICDNKSRLMLLSLTEQLTGSINHRNELLIILAIGTSNKSTSEIIRKNQNSTSMNTLQLITVLHDLNSEWPLAMTLFSVNFRGWPTTNETTAAKKTKGEFNITLWVPNGQSEINLFVRNAISFGERRSLR